MAEAMTSTFMDIQGLASLRSHAREAPGTAISEVAGQFESLFVQMMLKSMRDATVDGGLFDSSQLDTYQQMFDQQISLELSQQGGIGLAEILVTQLGGGAQTEPVIDEVGGVQPLVSLERPPLRVQRDVPGLIPPAAERQSVVRAVSATGQDGLATSPEEFIQAVWDDAVVAAGELGLDPAVLVAQSALETGWGKKVIQAADGSSSFNLFGIKVGNGWRGDSSIVNTMEFRDGLAALEKAAFRVYDSLSTAFKDYVSFLKNNPRYQGALEKVSDSKAFLTELQQAGYATDPKYAEKILGILERGNYSNLVNQLKNSGKESLTGT
ncbi:MAG: flagellar assembly peptidoglycan hydrolase FlgJ [Porticoccus sp.]|jgi:flagellar protein FlgJ|nr:flagellar assembly peptidoglycan hydrolase FlgJ [Porticoccus sp.]MBG56709.1 flagellar assembly peptidoglycan hydrolase FlgJ [Porticoccus sp.]|tara:strand:+ start:6884 stop:7855 length:972 start_codon:yes stop_codon:yes gene_type:complete